MSPNDVPPIPEPEDRAPFAAGYEMTSIEPPVSKPASKG